MELIKAFGENQKNYNQELANLSPTKQIDNMPQNQLMQIVHDLDKEKEL